MFVSAVLSPLSSERRTISTKWIISQHIDLSFIIAPVLTGYLLIFLNVWVGISAFFLWWFWQISVNGPHFFATISRTYCDKEEWKQRKTLLLASLLWIGLGPSMLAMDGVVSSSIPSIVFYLFQLGWAYYHVVRQHYGLFCIYQKKNLEVSGHQNTRDYWCFNVAMFAPLLIWLLRYPPYREAYFGGLEDVVDMVVAGATILMVAALVGYVLNVVWEYWRKGIFNLPKSLFFLAYVSLHWAVILLLPAPYVFDVLLLNVILTYPHNIQYMAIVWHYNKKRYHGHQETFGMAKHVSAGLWRFLFYGFAFGIVYFYLGWFFEGMQDIPFLPEVYSLARQPLVASHTLGEFVAVAMLGVIFNHYYLDQRIWRINRDAKVAADLGVK